MLHFFRSRSRQQRQPFGILPPHNPHPHPHHPHHYNLQLKIRSSNLSRRSSRLLIFILCVLAFLGFYALDSPSWFPILNLLLLNDNNRLPPLYPNYRLNELALPQHNLNISHPEARHGKYLWISDHTHGTHSTPSLTVRKVVS
jgi:hypothetical protein